MPTLHVITSAKGGVGKTLCTIAAAAHYQSTRTTVVDLNWNNPDVSRILSLQADPLPWGNFVRWPLAGESLNVLAQPFPFLVADGALGVWNRIDEAVEHCSTPTIIVDTNLHLVNLWPLYTVHEDDAKKKIQALIGEREITRAFIWFIWTLAALRRPPDAIRRRTAYDILYVSEVVEKMTSAFDEKGSRVEIIHVLNPHALFPERGLRNLFQGQFDVEVEGLRELADPKTETVRAVEFERFARLAIDTFDRANYDGIDDVRVFVPLSHAILEALHGRPRNVFPIPTYSANVINYIDHAALGRYLELNRLLEPLASITPVISRCLTAL